MTIEEIIMLAKEKLGKDISEQEALDYLNGKTALPDEALEVVGGGITCADNPVCPRCFGSTLARFPGDNHLECNMCGYIEGSPEYIDVERLR